MRRQSINNCRIYKNSKGNLLQMAYCFYIMSKILIKQSRFRFARFIIGKSFQIILNIDSDLEIFAEALRDRPISERSILTAISFDKIISIEKLLFEKSKQITFHVTFLQGMLILLFEIEFINGHIVKAIDLGSFFFFY